MVDVVVVVVQEVARRRIFTEVECGTKGRVEDDQRKKFQGKPKTVEKVIKVR